MSVIPVDSNTCTPSISVVIATLGQRKTFFEALDSAMKACERYPCEIVIVAPNTTLESIKNKCVEKYSSEELDRLIFVQETSSGIYEAMNLGLEYSHNIYVAFLNDDDRFLPNSIDEVFDSLNEDRPDLVCATTFVEFKCCGLFHPIIAESKLGSRILYGEMPSCHQSQIWKRQVLLNCNGFSRRINNRLTYFSEFFKIQIACDFDLFVRAYKTGISYKRSDVLLSIVDANGESGKLWRRTYLNLNKVIWFQYRPGLKWLPILIRNIVGAEIFHRNSRWVHSHD
jgi:glycosyltransferase involved in cell wall biosynthesis